MTTDSPTDTTSRAARPYGVAALGVAVLAVSCVGVVVTVLGAVFEGTTGLVGGLVGAGATLLVLAAGFALVDLVSSVMPTFSLLFALLTYSFQMLVLGGLLVVLRTSDDIEQTLSPGWFAAGVIGVALTWTVVLVAHALRARVPLYDLPDDSLVRAPAPVPAPAVERSER
jgi:ATP synthase protein I